ncbi:MAG: glycosyltransferase [Candidatus Sumerlaeota bacterium]|nr:glycosyltransferase [Candidatus Sumerlaeota bacterium]
MVDRPRVLHVYKDFWPPFVGGVEKTIHLMCRATSDEFAPTVLVSNRRGRDERETVNGIPVVKAATFGRWLSAPLTPRLAAWIRRLPTDLIHVHLPNPTAEISVLWARPPAPVVVTWHSDIVRQAWALRVYQRWHYRFLERAARIMPTSPDYARTSAHLQRFASKCVCVPLAVDVRACELSESERTECERLRAGKKRPVVAFVGRLRYYKGLQFLIEAMRQVEAEAWIIGDGPEGPALRKQARDAGLAERVLFLGALDDSAVRIRLHAADVYCLPAHLRAEAFGLSQVEAMACGLPAVSTAVGGVAFVNRDNESGLIVPPGDAGALAKALNRVLADGELRSRLSQGARRRAREEFDLPRLGERLKAVYRDVLGAQ